VFDLGKLDWMNAEYIKALSIDELYERALPFLEAKEWYAGRRGMQDAGCNDELVSFVKRVLVIERDRLVKLSDIGDETPFFFGAPAIDAAMLPWKDNTPEATRSLLECARNVLLDVPEGAWTREKLGEFLLAAAGEKRGDFLWPLRVALCGERKSPPPQDLAWVIGKAESLARIDAALKKCRE
jgi:glutamyl-tRNA synthetase